MTTLTDKLAADLATQIMGKAIADMTDDELTAIASGGPGDYDLTQASHTQLERLAAGADPLVVLGPDFPRNP